MATPLPEPPSGDFFDKTQWDVLTAFVNAAIPSMTSKSALKDEKAQIAVSDELFGKILDDAEKSMSNPPTREALKEFFEFSPAKNPRAADNILRSLSWIAPDNQKALGKVLSVLG